MDTELVQIFAKAKLRLTAPRVAIFNALKTSHAPQSIAQLVRAVPSIDKVSVYRTIRLFESLGIITPVTRGWKQLYELSAPFQPHHHHMVCKECGQVVTLQSPAIEDLIQTLSKEHSFSPTSHHFEIQGTCRKCSK